MAPIIEVENLGKQYRIGQAEPYHTLRESLVGLIKSPLRKLRAGPQVDDSKRTIWALKDVSFTVNPGEVVGIIGRNGAGKSTLLKILSRITKPSAGRITLGGRIGSLLEVGTGFHPELSGRENIYLNGAILGMHKAEIRAKFDEIVAFSEIEQFLDTPVKRYSSGMYMRLAFAVAAHLEPEILIVDEVLAVGDAGFQKKCLGKMKEVGRSGRTVLFVSHNMNAVEQLCERAMLLDHGQIKRFDSDVRSVINEHLFGAHNELESSEWQATTERHRNPFFTPVRFAVTDAHGQALTMPASNDTEMFLTVEGDVEQLDPALTVGYAIYNEDGHLLYWSYQTDGPEDKWPRLQIGRNKLVGRIPSRFFNEGTYRVELIASLHFRSWLFEPGVTAPSIFLTIQGGLSESPYWMAKRPGMLAPALEWKLA